MSAFCLIGAHRWKPCLRWLVPPRAESVEQATMAALLIPGLVTTVLAGHWKPQLVKNGHKCRDCGKRKP